MNCDLFNGTKGEEGNQKKTYRGIKPNLVPQEYEAEALFTTMDN
jgi:hypothetical protein